MVIDSSEEWLVGIFAAVVSDVQASGYFTQVNQHEPDRSPGPGITAAVWVQALEPVRVSGLHSTSARIEFIVRMYSNMHPGMLDYIDPQMIKAASNLVRRYHDDFDFGGAIRNIDLFGEFGTPLSVVAGYLPIAEKKTYRIMDITVPCIVNDVWQQVT